jgi:hypothetical protein
MITPIRKVILAIALIVITGLFAGCGGGSSSDTSADNPPAAPAQVDLSGVWQTEEVVNGNCGDTDYPYTEIHVYTGTQQGNTVTMRDETEGIEFNGTVSGLTLSANTTVPDGSGTLTINITCTCAADGQSFNGTGQWTYQETGYSCSGTIQVTGSKLADAQVDATGTWNGSFASTEYSGVSGTFAATIVDTAGQLTGTISVPYIGMDNAELVGTVDGSVITFGDIDNRITFTGAITTAGAASGSYEYDFLGDEGSWTANR